MVLAKPLKIVLLSELEKERLCRTQKTVAGLNQNFNVVLALWKFEIKIVLEIEKTNKKQRKGTIHTSP